MEVVDENAAPARAPHLTEHLSALIIRQMMKRQRANCGIKRVVPERQARSISHHRSREARALQSVGIDVERNNPAGS